MRISTSQIFRAGLAGVMDQQSQLARAQRQLVSGQRISTAADDPAAAATAARLDHRVNDLSQFERNISAARASLAVQDEAVSRVVDRLQRLREIAIAAESGANSPAEHRSYAVEVQQIRDEILEVANTSDNAGRYAFAGYQSQTRPFSQVAGTVVYAGDNGTRALQVAPSRLMVTAEPGSQVFEGVLPGNGAYRVGAVQVNTGSGVIRDQGPAALGAYAGSYEIRFTATDRFDVVDVASGTVLLADQPYAARETIAFVGARVAIEGQPQSGDVFSVAASSATSLFVLVDELHTALSGAASDAPGQAQLSQSLSNSIGDLDRGLDQLLAVRARLGARLSSLDSQESSNADLGLVTQQALSDLRDLDYAAAITDFNRYLTGLQAAQQSFARMQEISLFSLLR